MSSQGIIGQTPALLYQMQIGFAGLEKYLNILHELSYNGSYTNPAFIRTFQRKKPFPTVLVYKKVRIKP